jgi:hypothetical protein
MRQPRYDDTRYFKHECYHKGKRHKEIELLAITKARGYEDVLSCSLS